MAASLEPKITQETQVLIVGAGAIGCSVAYQLARRSVVVTVIDPAGIASGTSSATLGLVWVQQKPPVEYLDLNLLSSQMYPELVKNLDEDVELNQPGGVDSYLDETYFTEQLAVMTELNAASPQYQARHLTPTEACQMEPDLSREIVGAIYCPHDGEINPIKLVQQLARGARKHGTIFLHNTRVIRIAVEDGCVFGVETDHDFLRSPHVVVAAGTASSAFVRSLGIEMPQLLERGQILVTEPVRRILIHPTDISRQTLRGNILLGTTHEMNCQNKHLTTAGGLRYIADQSVRRFPALKDVNILRAFSGIRPLPKDGLPYLGAVSRVPGLYVATSHSGITLAPVHGKVISDLIVDGTTRIPIGSYNPERFMI